jgi:hypothetical protein
MARTGKTAAAVVSCLVLGGCAGQDAITHLALDVPNVERVDIVHARFPCFSPEFHLYGYRSSDVENKQMELRRHLLEFFNATMDVGDAARV